MPKCLTRVMLVPKVYTVIVIVIRNSFYISGQTDIAIMSSTPGSVSTTVNSHGVSLSPRELRYNN